MDSLALRKCQHNTWMLGHNLQYNEDILTICQPPLPVVRSFTDDYKWRGVGGGGGSHTGSFKVSSLNCTLRQSLISMLERRFRCARCSISEKTTEQLETALGCQNVQFIKQLWLVNCADRKHVGFLPTQNSVQPYSP